MTIEHLPVSAWDRNPMPLGNDLLCTITRLDRDRLERLIAVAIDYLDNLDGDPDLENYNVDEEDSDPDHCICGDDGMGPIFQNGKLHWGSDHDDYG